MKEVRWTETAKQTLNETSEFLLNLWDEQIHENFLDQLEYRIRQLQHNPELGIGYENSQFRKLEITKHHPYFMSTKGTSSLLVIWDNRSDTDQLLKKLTDANRT